MIFGLYQILRIPRVAPRPRAFPAHPLEDLSAEGEVTSEAFVVIHVAMVAVLEKPPSGHLIPLADPVD
ncbi:MAG: hypothetical protein AAFU70_10510, partial [Planctomycetota bacterium]